MTLNIDEDALNRKLRIISDESLETAMPWLKNNPGDRFSKPFKRVEPFPGACVKTWDEDGKKLFVNVCHSKEILPPEDLSVEQFMKILDEDVPSFIIPMALGLEKMAKDKEDIERPTFDILVNTNYFQKCMKNAPFWQFTVVAILESINDKYNKTIVTSKFVTLQNRKVMGSLDSFTIEDREPRKPQKPLIQELDRTSSKRQSKTSCSAQDKTKVGVKAPKNDHHLGLQIEELKPSPLESKLNGTTIDEKSAKIISEKRPAMEECTDRSKFVEEQFPDQNYMILMSGCKKKIIGFFYTPYFNVDNLTVDIGENRIIIENQKAEIIFDIFIPHLVVQDQAIADFDSKLHILRLTLPLKT
ncbi:hypothetical protein QAD02_000224 [Eretmocerus hayati]|uniref:Uncharacterized protein n=1 Tax=Eretmocerus hayati TaxID=131215 RepID=A0ACC2NCV0_9HYME|nr:hypothetical protein QAD02_000224 [Eretmocerus hayati]